MPASARRAVTALSAATVGVLAAATMAAPAPAAQTVVQNACYYSLDGFWRDLDVRVAGAASPVYVPPGAGFKLTGTAAAAAFPGWVAEYGFNLGFLQGSAQGVKNTIPAEVWVAVAGRGSAQGVQVVRSTVSAETTITTDAAGEVFRSATPLSVTVPFGDTTWTAPTAAGAPVTFEQAPAGTLPTIAGVNGGAAIVPRGSIFIRAALSKGTVFDLDCQPGRFTSGGDAFAPGAVSPFEIAYVDPNAVPTGVEAPPLASPPIVLRSTTLRANKARTSAPLKVRNSGGTVATGQVKVTTVAKQRLRKGGPKRTLVVQDWADYTVAAGARKTLTVKLSKDLRTVLKGKKLVKLQIATRATNGLKTEGGLPRYAKATRATVSLKR
jgi:hypothetical protein